MLIPPDEHSLLLAERWLKPLSDRAQAALTAYRSALRHYFTFCSQRHASTSSVSYPFLV